jgi:hypothetical protein
MANKKDSKRKKEELGGEHLKMSLLKDDTYKKYLKIVKTIRDKIDLEDLDDEMTRLHSGRISRTLYGTTPGGDKIMKAALQDSSVRSRLAEIRVRVTKQADLLDITLKATRIHLANSFRDEVDDLRTKGERGAFFDGHLQKGVSLLARMNSFTSRVDTIVKDIDQTGFSLKHAVDILELIYSRNNDKKGA